MTPPGPGSSRLLPDRRIDELTHQITHGPNQLAALQELRTIMTTSIAAITPNPDTPEGP